MFGVAADPPTYRCVECGKVLDWPPRVMSLLRTVAVCEECWDLIVPPRPASYPAAVARGNQGQTLVAGVSTTIRAARWGRSA